MSIWYCDEHGITGPRACCPKASRVEQIDTQQINAPSLPATPAGSSASRAAEPAPGFLEAARLMSKPGHSAASVPSQPGSADEPSEQELRELAAGRGLAIAHNRIARLARYALRLKAERDDYKRQLDADSPDGWTPEHDAMLAKIADEHVQKLISERTIALESRALAAERRVAELEAVLADAIYTVSAGRVSSMGGVHDTFSPQISKATVAAWRAIHERGPDV